MNPDTLAIGFGIAIGLYFVWFLAGSAYQTYKHGSLKGALFGARITETQGEVEGKGSKILKVRVRVHKLEAKDPDKIVGLELVAKTFASYQMFPVPMSPEEALKLAEMLREAALEPSHN